MPDDVPPATLAAVLDAVRRREARRRRRTIALRAASLLAFAATLLAAWHVLDPDRARTGYGIGVSLIVLLMIGVLGAVAWLVALSDRPDELWAARELDRRLRLLDRVASALAVVERPSASALAARVVADAQARLRAAGDGANAAFPDAAPRGLARRARLLGLAALVAIAAAVVTDLLGLFGLLPWFGTATRPGGAPDAAAPPTETSPPGPGATAAPARPGAVRPSESRSPGESPPRDTPPAGDVRVALKLAKAEFDAREPVEASVAAAPTGLLAGEHTFDVRIAVDADDSDTGEVLRIGAAHPEGERVTLDLRHVPGLRLPPGEHTAMARLTTRDSHEEHRSAPVKFRIRPEPSPRSDGGAKEPPPQSQPRPQPAPPQPSATHPDGRPPGEKTPPPPAHLDRKLVVPLFREGDEVKKHGLVVVLDPGGGDDVPPVERPLADALPEARRRAESEVDRAGLRPEDREMVRRYFEILERLAR